MFGDCEARHYMNFSIPPLLFFSYTSLVISSVPEQLLSSQERLGFLELVVVMRCKMKRVGHVARMGSI
jgi:hypothetical protein